MAQAACQNPACEHEWRLTKPVDSYSGDGPNCPKCGTTRVEIRYDGDGQQTQQAQPPQRTQQNGGQDGVPANEGSLTFGQPESAGDALAQGVLTLTSDEVDPQDKAQSVKSIGGALVDGAARLYSYQDQINKQQEENAKNVGLQKADDKPRCQDCGHVFSQIPMSANRVQCPDCGEEYEIVAQDG